MKRPNCLFALAPAAVLMFAAFQGQEAKPAKAAAQAGASAMVVDEQKPSYPLDTCPMSGEPLGDEPIDYVHEGRLVRLCCKMCIKDLSKEGAAAKVIAKIDAAVIAAQKASYPLEDCVVSGKKIGDPASGMEPHDYVHGTRLVRFCCQDCVKSFQKDSARHMAKIDEALIAQQRPSYPITTCVVSGEELGEEPFDMLYGTRLVRLCCKDCVKELKQNPEPLLAKLSK